MAKCFRCNADFPPDIPLTRSEECPRCFQPLRCCRNCGFYSSGSHWDCRETVSEQVLDKERANFCDFFRLNTRGGGGRETGRGSVGRSSPDGKETPPARKAFDDLFS
ncbi:hypothetical protein AU468_02015 [Alkalispirochaeta sphaeroplastigenens]|uniref:Uncharacterized protein n=1 Tax=Alkalispirochaeta sphaeroplastigenens TaxID=1187066 RepID=A0A2S4K0K0_9SPIO|nr:hypothetical protein AU468_02015 [Alkalispirochaeta sphaeroplastigenens]